MRVIGFNFTKISVDRKSFGKKPVIDTNIEFLNVEKEDVELLKDQEPIKVTFKCNWNYSETEKKDNKIGQIAFQGEIIIATESENAKELVKNWKKKKIDTGVQVPMFNLILKKCTPRAAQLADEVNLPSPIPLPKIKPPQKKE